MGGTKSVGGGPRPRIPTTKQNEAAGKADDTKSGKASASQGANAVGLPEIIDTFGGMARSVLKTGDVTPKGPWLNPRETAVAFTRPPWPKRRMT
jgi:hypothetical protein